MGNHKGDKEMPKKNELVELPSDIIIEDILTRVPAKSLLRFKCVSKSWCTMINSPYFCQLHTRKYSQKTTPWSFVFFGSNSLYSFDYNKMDHGARRLHCPREICCEGQTKFLGSCNGLLCFQLAYDQFALYNPTTRAYKQLPKVEKVLEQQTYLYRSSDFAYDSRTDDYNVIRFASYYGKSHLRGDFITVYEESHLYSLKANSWEIIPSRPFAAAFCSTRVVSNNSLHWLIRISNNEVIWRFDLSTREYQQIQLPRKLSYPGKATNRLFPLNGHLHVLANRSEIWMMKEYGVEESWTQLFQGVDTPLKEILYYCDFCLPCPNSKDGTKFLVGKKEHRRSFVCCDLASNNKHSGYYGSAYCITQVNGSTMGGISCSLG